MNTVKVRNIEIGAGIPKICVPIVGVTRDEILDAAKSIAAMGTDVVEWRVDWYQDVFNFDEVEKTVYIEKVSRISGLSQDRIVSNLQVDNKTKSAINTLDSVYKKKNEQNALLLQFNLVKYRKNMHYRRRRTCSEQPEQALQPGT